MKNWLLRHGQASHLLREELAAWTEWLSNCSPPFAAYRALMGCRLIALDKEPGVRPLGIGEIWRRAIAKCALSVCGQDAKAACGSTNLCAGLEAGIEGALHSVRQRMQMEGRMVFGEFEGDDDPGPLLDGEEDADDDRELFTQPDPPEDEMDELSDNELVLLVDAANGFNNLSRYSMLWTVRHRCSRLSRLAFNCYRHALRLVCRQPGSAATILLSREGVTQGDPLSMALYGIALLPLAETLRSECGEVLQPWYADDAAMQGTPRAVSECFTLLCRLGPMHGYFPEPEKSYAICPEALMVSARSTFIANNLPVSFVSGHRYVGGHVGSRAMRDKWIAPQVAKWTAGIKALASVARKFPQSAYCGFVHSLQAEWQSLCRCVPDIDHHLVPIETAIRHHLIPVLFDIDPGEITDEWRTLLTHGVKQGGMNIRNPVLGADHLYQTSLAASTTLVASLLHNTPLDSNEHRTCVRKAGAMARKERVDGETAVVKGMMIGATKLVRKRLERIGETGAWLTVLSDKLYETCLSAEEWRDNARIRNGLRPTGLCSHCDGCGAGFTVEHGLNCKKGGLVGIRHDDVRNEAGALAAMALSKTKVTYEPMIYYGRDIPTQQNPAETTTGDQMVGGEERGDVLVHSLWEKGRGCVLDIRITDTDARSYQSIASHKVLERAAKVKKTKYNEACLERRRSFMPLVYSVDGLACKEARAFEKRVASLLATKWERAYSEMAGFVKSRMSLAIIRSNTMLLRGARSSRRFAPAIQAGCEFDAMAGIAKW